MARTPIWKSIQDTLTAQIAEGEYAPGDKLPTEAVLAARFGVNRHTVRRALSEMAELGHLYARRGAGVFVTQKPTVYPIGKRVRFHQNLRASGREPTKEILTLETRIAGEQERVELKLAEGGKVHVYEGLSLSDGLPIAFSRSFFPAALLPDLPDDLTQSRSVTAALAQSGIRDYTRTSTHLTAVQADATLALHLRLQQKAPLLHSVGLNVDQDGTPVEWGHTWFAGERVTLTLADL
jgi:GntR family phosphonate transport system transcriptional regulator